jgi:hyperosmotically inducible protein
MKIKFIAIMAGLLALAIGLAACSDTTPGTNANANRAAANANLNANNTGVVVNANSTNTNTNSNRWNSNISKEDYEKNKAGYEKEKTTTEVIGTGINDSYLWFKTRSALAMANDLRDSTLSVSVSNEVTTLAGTVANAAQKTSAETVAKGITGVKSVENEIKVAANDSMTNQMVNGNTRPANSSKANSNTAVNKK